MTLLSQARSLALSVADAVKRIDAWAQRLVDANPVLKEAITAEAQVARQAVATAAGMAASALTPALDAGAAAVKAGFATALSTAGMAIGGPAGAAAGEEVAEKLAPFEIATVDLVRDRLIEEIQVEALRLKALGDDAPPKAA